MGTVTSNNGALDLSQTKGLPEAASIVKQIMYGSYIKTKYADNDVFNVFILPYDSRSMNGKTINADDSRLVYVGTVSSDWEADKTYGKIYAFLVDLRYLVRCWSRVDHAGDRELLCRQMSEVCM